MKRDLAINITSGFLLLVGLVTLVLPMFLAATRAELLTTNAQALLLLVAAWLLYKRHKLEVLFLAISAVVYLASNWYSASTHNLPISALIPAFFWSLALRVLLVAFIFYLLKGPASSAVLTHHSSGTR
ncbi:hypothetical protein [Thiobacillus sp.]|jgi:hypothetical protein|uniref:hypothetical protein n=1 Tax=Thiobacillus sp. TaxID=924 RepID=UPI0025FE2ED1|nr:hypothetical protein [Thiobacillus sp.]